MPAESGRKINLRTLPFSSGVSWLQDAFELVMREKLLAFGLGFLYFIFFAVVTVIPFLGAIASPFVSVFLFGGLCLFYRALFAGKKSDISSLFSAFKHSRAKHLVLFSVLYFVASILLSVVAFVIFLIGSSLVGILFGGNLIFSVFIGAVAFLPLAFVLPALLLYGPLFVLAGELDAVESAKKAVSMMIVNWRPFLLSSLILTAALLVPAIAFALLSGVFASEGAVFGILLLLLAVPLLLLLAPLSAAFAYVSYRDAVRIVVDDPEPKPLSESGND